MMFKCVVVKKRSVFLIIDENKAYENKLDSMARY